MITKRSIIGVLLYGHNLYTIIAIFYNPGQHLISEFYIGAHLLRILPHSYMAFINKQGVFFRLEILNFPFIGCRIPYLSRKYLCVLVLYYALCPSWYTLSMPPIPIDVHFVQLPMFKSFFR